MRVNPFHFDCNFPALSLTATNMSVQLSAVGVHDLHHGPAQTISGPPDAAVVAALGDMLTLKLAAFSDHINERLDTHVDRMTCAISATIATEVRKKMSLDATRFAALHEQLDSLEKLVAETMEAAKPPFAKCKLSLHASNSAMKLIKLSPITYNGDGC